MSGISQAVKGCYVEGSASARLLEAAVEEFSRHGLAGARVDRIADAAQAVRA